MSRSRMTAFFMRRPLPQAGGGFYSAIIPDMMQTPAAPQPSTALI
jgi:hypothetical protein